jgi:putative ABC transport system substrate-binding protein
MRRREFIAFMGATATWPFTALAQQAGRTYRPGMVSPLPCEATPSTSPLTLAFQDGLRHLGFVKDQNLTFACRDVGHNIDLSSQYAAELVKGAVDVIVVFGDVAVRAAQQATKTIPIVVATDDMLGEGLVSSLARPDGNTTGISILAGELDGKRQEILIEAVPGVRRIATLADSNVSSREAQRNAGGGAPPQHRAFCSSSRQR